MDHRSRENDVRNLYSNYNQTRAYVKCSPNHSKELHLIEAVDETLKISEKCWPFLHMKFARVLQFSSVSPLL